MVLLIGAFLLIWGKPLAFVARKGILFLGV